MPVSGRIAQLVWPKDAATMITRAKNTHNSKPSDSEINKDWATKLYNGMQKDDGTEKSPPESGENADMSPPLNKTVPTVADSSNVKAAIEDQKISITWVRAPHLRHMAHPQIRKLYPPQSASLSSKAGGIASVHTYMPSRRI